MQYLFVQQAVAFVTFIIFYCSNSRKAQMQKLLEESDLCFTY